MKVAGISCDGPKVSRRAATTSANRLPALLPISLQQLEPAQVCTSAACSEVLNDGLKRDWTVVGSSADKNRGYAVQWFSLSALVVGLFIWFQWLRPWRQRRAQPHHPV